MRHGRRRKMRSRFLRFSRKGSAIFCHDALDNMKGPARKPDRAPVLSSFDACGDGCGRMDQQLEISFPSQSWIQCSFRSRYRIARPSDRGLLLSSFEKHNVQTLFCRVGKSCHSNLYKFLCASSDPKCSQWSPSSQTQIRKMRSSCRWCC